MFIRILATSFFLVLATNLFSQRKYTIVDKSTLEALPFANCVSQDSTFFTYGDADGNILIPINKSISISYIGYKTLVLNTNHDLLKDTLFLENLASSIQPVTIKADRIDLYEMLNHLRVKYAKNEYTKKTNTLSSFETVSKKEVVEKAFIVSEDLISTKHAFTHKNRVHADYTYNVESPYLSIDIDHAVKEISLFGTSKKAAYHLFNSGKISRKKVNLDLIDVDGNIYTVKYVLPDHSQGFLLFDQAKNKILEFTVFYKKVDRLFKSINRLIDIQFNTFSIHYYFTEDLVNRIDFRLTSKIVSDNTIYTTAGEITETKAYQAKIIYPEKQISSIPLNAYYSRKDECLQRAFGRNLFSNLDEESIQNQELFTLAILNKLGFCSLIKSWQRERLSETNFKVFSENIDYSKARLNRADYHKFDVYWVFDPNFCDVSISYDTIHSIWNTDEAVFISKTQYHGLLLANLTFDIFEVYRKKVFALLNDKQSRSKKENLITEHYKLASNLVEEMNSKSKYGNSIKELAPYNKLVLQELEIDNFKALISLKNIKSTKDQFNLGDLYLAVEEYHKAIAFYEEELSGKITESVKVAILLNIAEAYCALKNKKRACEYYTKAMDLTIKINGQNNQELSVFRCKCL